MAARQEDAGEADAKFVASRTNLVTFKAHQTVQRAGSISPTSYTVLSGWASRAMHFPDGRRQILSFLVPGDTIFVEAIWVKDYRVPFTVRALTDLTLCAFEPAALHEIINSSSAQQDCFAVHIQRQFALAERRLVDVGQRRAVARIARLVLDLESLLRARGLASGEVFDFPLRQEDIGDALGLTTAHVNRTLVMLRRRRILDISQGRAFLMNREELISIGATE